jgi:transposase
MSTVNQRVIKNKLGLLNLAEELGNISKACKVMGLSRNTFYRYQSAVADGGIDALLDKNRRKPNIKNRVDEQIEQAVVAYAIDNPAYGQLRASNELRKHGVFVSPGGVRCIWLRHGLESLKKRLNQLELKAANEGLVLTESQLVALEKKQDDDGGLW